MPAVVKADSVRCANSQAPVECVIQADKSLTALGDEMNKAYEQRMAPMNEDEKAAFKYQQEYWLKMRAPSCGLSKLDALTTDRVTKAATCLTAHYHDRIASLAYQCEVDEGHTVEEMATWKEPWSDKVPAGFKIDQRMVAFVVTPDNLTVIPIHSLPLDKPQDPQKPTGLLKYGYRDVAQCRAQDPEGHWWLVVGHRSLSYVPEEQTMTVAKYTAKVAHDNKSWREEHKQYLRPVHPENAQ